MKDEQLKISLDTDKDISQYVKTLNEQEESTIKAIGYFEKYFEWYKILILRNKIASGSIHDFIINDLSAKFGDIDKNIIHRVLIKKMLFRTYHVTLAALIVSAILTSTVYFYLQNKTFTGITLVSSIVFTLLICAAHGESCALSFIRVNKEKLKALSNQEGK